MHALVPVILAGLLGVPIPPDSASIRQFEATPPAARPGDKVTLSWHAVGTDRVRIEPLGLEVPANSWLTFTLRERTTFWIHADNLKGGQSIPLGVELITPAALPEVAGPPAPPPAPAPVPAKPAGPPPAERTRPGTVWIQFAALWDPWNAAMLRKDLKRLLGIDATVALLDPSGPSGPKLQRIRLGPFPSRQAARLRLKLLRARLRRMKLAPIVTVD